MGFVKTAVLTAVLLVLAGCTSTGPMLGSGKEIPLIKMDKELAKSFPVTRKSSFGTVKVLGVSTVPGAGEKQLTVGATFNLVSFEIPEGINGTVRYLATLRYDPSSRRLYLANLKPVSLSFANRSLEEYVSRAARNGIPKLIAGILASTPIYQMESSFNARGVKGISVTKESVAIDFN